MNEPPAKCQHFLDAIAECQESGLITQYFNHYYLHPDGLMRYNLSGMKSLNYTETGKKFKIFY